MEDNNDIIKVICEKCGQRYKVNNPNEVKIYHCKKCDNIIKVYPQKTDEDYFEPDNEKTDKINHKNKSRIATLYGLLSGSIIFIVLIISHCPYYFTSSNKYNLYYNKIKFASLFKPPDDSQIYLIGIFVYLLISIACGFIVYFSVYKRNSS